LNKTTETDAGSGSASVDSGSGPASADAGSGSANRTFKEYQELTKSTINVCKIEGLSGSKDKN